MITKLFQGRNGIIWGFFLFAIIFALGQADIDFKDKIGYNMPIMVRPMKIDNQKQNRRGLPKAAALVLYVSILSVCYAQYGPAIEPAALDYIGLRKLVLQDPNLTGSGVTIASICRSMTYTNGRPQGDFHFNMKHQSLIGADVLFEDNSDGNSGISAHATAIGGILLGLDPQGYHPQTGDFFYVGACPDASVQAFEFWRFVSLYIYGKRPFDADIMTLSLGEVFADWWTRGIEKLAADKGLLVFAAAGNGKNVYDPLLYPAAGTNTIAVGVINAALDTNTGSSLSVFSVPSSDHSSTGPTADKRCKPDIVAPGTCLIPSPDSEIGYDIQADWSSLATPMTAGAAALLLQKAKQDPALADAVSQNGGNCVIKAILMSAANKLPYWHKGNPGTQDDHNTPLDFTQGAGAVDIERAHRILVAGKADFRKTNPIGWDNNTLAPDNPVKIYPVSIPPAGRITITLNWNTHYGDVFPYKPIQSLDNNLRLELWAIDPTDPNRNTMLDYSDSRYDNVEHLFVQNEPNFTEYQIVVRYSGDSNSLSAQKFGIAWMAGNDAGGNNPWWYDLNSDGKIDTTDKLICFVLDRKMQDYLRNPQNKPFYVSDDRLEVLTAEWELWKSYLADWNYLLANIEIDG